MLGDGDPAQKSKDPVARGIATAGARVSPSGGSHERKENDEDEARVAVAASRGIILILRK